MSVDEISHGTFCFSSQRIACRDSTISGIHLLSFTTHRFVIHAVSHRIYFEDKFLEQYEVDFPFTKICLNVHLF